ncbi:MAG TPA: hypothetical protein VFK61_06860 [Candidatus Limnocylindria bacterium]|nr:hypothetical protein [Candidatus Limnocylindria bacterium]
MQAVPSSASSRPSAPSGRVAWIAVAFGLWLISGFFLVLWAIAQGQSPDVAASPFHIPVYAGLVTLALFSLVTVVRSVRRGKGWRAALPGHPATIVGSAFLVSGLLLDVGWREGVGIGQGIEGGLAPSRIMLAIGFFLVAASPLLAAIASGPRAVPVTPVVVSTGLAIGLLSWPGGFHPAASPRLEEEIDIPGQAAELWVMDADGSHQTRLLEAGPHQNFGYASWMGDGSRIAYTLFEFPGGTLESGQASIWSIRADGGAPQANLRGDDWNWIPRWSPDGAWLAFTREAPGGPWMEAGPAGPEPGGAGGEGPLSVPLPQADIWRFAATGGEPERLTDSPGDDRAPVYSPDGASILFDSTRDGNTEIYVMNADGSDERRLTFDDGEDWGASWSPDGRQIAFNSSRDGGMDIYVMRADGTDVRRLTFGETGNVAPTWNPDGTELAYTARDDTLNGQIMAVPVAGGTPRNLSRSAPAADEVWTGGWGPDGRIVFNRVLNPDSGETGAIHEDLAAAGLLITAVLVAAMLVLLAGLRPPFGSLTAASLIGFALASSPTQDWRFVPVGLLVGLAADTIAWRIGERWRAPAVGAAACCLVVLGSGAVVLMTTRLAWSPTLLIGVALAAAAAGWATGMFRVASAAAFPPPDG